MNPKLLFSFISLLVLSPSLSAQKKDAHFSIGVESHAVIAGELNSSYDFLLGIRGKYFFHSSSKIVLYSTVGFSTDLANSNVRFISADFQFGGKLPLNKRLAFQISLGASYNDEKHSFSLIDRDVDWHNSFFGISGQFEIDYKLSRQISLNTFIKQTNSIHTSTGLGINYSF